MDRQEIFASVAASARERMREIYEICGHKRPQGARGLLWDAAKPLRGVPAIQDAVSVGAHIPFLSVDADLVRSLRTEDGVRFGSFSSPLADTGEGPYEGARLVGHLEVATGKSVEAAMLSYCTETAKARGNRGPALPVAASEIFFRADTTRRFGRALADHALGVLDGEIPGCGILRDFEFEAGLGLDVQRFAEAAGRTMFVDAWARREEGNGTLPSGANPGVVAPATPPEAKMQAARLCGRIERTNAATVEELLERAYLARSGTLASGSDAPRPSMAHFAGDLALMALGSGVSWFDDEPEFELKVPGFEYTSEAGLAAVDERSYAPSP